jgi:hypothetical protein
VVYADTRADWLMAAIGTFSANSSFYPPFFWCIGHFALILVLHKYVETGLSCIHGTAFVGLLACLDWILRLLYIEKSSCPLHYCQCWYRKDTGLLCWVCCISAGTDVRFLNVFAKICSENFCVFCSNYILLVFAKIVIITLVFEKNATFSTKMAKIAENCDRKMDPWCVNHLKSCCAQVPRLILFYRVLVSSWLSIN